LRAEKDTPSAQNLSDTANIHTADSQPQSNLQEEQKPDPNALIKSQYDNDPLLKSYIPSAPSDRIMRALLAEPPLSYNASRAGPPLTGKAPRKFCCICGYWGKIRCRNCHQRTCGIECYKTHEDSRCGAFF
jgi:zinc finger HIT domain-containing protein 1